MKLQRLKWNSEWCDELSVIKRWVGPTGVRRVRFFQQSQSQHYCIWLSSIKQTHTHTHAYFPSWETLFCGFSGENQPCEFDSWCCLQGLWLFLNHHKDIKTGNTNRYSTYVLLTLNKKLFWLGLLSLIYRDLHKHAAATLPTVGVFSLLSADSKSNKVSGQNSQMEIRCFTTQTQQGV